MASGDGSTVKKLLIVDTDSGVDDALAILYLLSQPDVEILAFTCTHGNTTLDNVALNVLTTLSVAKHKQDIPVFEGAEQALVRSMNRASYYHGNNGLGDKWDRDPGLLDKIDRSEMAVNALIRLVKEYPNQITLVCLGPLTNIALAHRMSPGFHNSLKELFIMGGNVYGRGNGPDRLGSEFNFYSDPESAHIILNEFDCRTTLVPWETCLDAVFEWSVVEKMVTQDTERSRFAGSILEVCKQQCRKGSLTGVTICDLVAVVLLCHPEIVQKRLECGCVVELTGAHSTGTVFLDTRLETDRKIRIFVEKIEKTQMFDEVINMMMIE